MINISKNSIAFIEKYVLRNIAHTTIEEDNAGDSIDEILLKNASAVVTEITSLPDW